MGYGKGKGNSQNKSPGFVRTVSNRYSNAQPNLFALPLLVPIHGHSLRIPAQLSVGGGTDRSAATMSARRAALFQSQKLLGTEGLVVDLTSGLDEVLQVGTGQEVS